MKKVILSMCSFLILFSAGNAFAEKSSEASINPSSVSEVAQAIWWVKPRLPESKVARYARAIALAAKKYSIDPLTLVAIAHQESSFREDLPTGKAGEIGLLQIRKMWIQNKKFRRVFKGATVSDLRNPDRAFLFAAWILSDLKKSRSQSEKLPYWTYYNSKRFRNRFTYYMRVKRHLASIETKRQKKDLLLARNN
jgi:soluble lytic murein transglycosylase-like protein